MRAEQTGEKKVTAAKKEAEGREKRETELTEKRGIVVVVVVVAAAVVLVGEV